HAENREWKRKRQERTLIDENLSPPPQKENRENAASQEKENNRNIRDPRQSRLKPKLFANFHNRNGGSSSTASSRSKPRHPATKSSLPQNSVKPDDSNESWKFSHEIRNQLKARRPNTDKGEKELEKRILIPFVTPVYFSHGATFEGLKNEDLTSFMIKVTKRFCGSDEKVLKFPPELTGFQRKMLHRQAELLGLNSVSFGEGEGRFLVVMKQDVEVFE
ncbi:1450_t:CDS:1, partial [Acaulospora morrowiae]